MKKVYPLLIILPLLAACSTTTTQKTSSQPITIKPTRDTNSLDILMGQFAHNIENIWGFNEVIIAGPLDYVKYSDHFQTRSHINFDAGTIIIETIKTNHIQENLEHAIINTLMMPADESSFDLYKHNNKPETSLKTPFLFGQVVDNEKQPIGSIWRATRFANYLIEHHLKKRHSNQNTISYVEINLVKDHVDQRAKQFISYVNLSAKKYNIPPSLILSIMEVESKFNPYAISRSSAIGLMQVQPHTAGRDLHKFKGRSGQPSQKYLLDPKNNIDMGTAYLAIIRDNYLVGITNPLSMRYAMITSYNGGAGSVLRVFSNDRRKAVEIINTLTPEKVFYALSHKHPSQESRDYLLKVSQIQRKYLR